MTTDTNAAHQARKHPAEAYPSPEALAADGSLTREQRIEMLQRWERDLEARATAVGEGMPPAPPDHDLRDVALALRSLGADPKATDDTDGRADIPYADIPFGRETAEGAAGSHAKRRPLPVTTLVLGTLAVVAFVVALAGTPLLGAVAGGLLLLAALAARGRRAR